MYSIDLLWLAIHDIILFMVLINVVWYIFRFLTFQRNPNRADRLPAVGTHHVYRPYNSVILDDIMHYSVDAYRHRYRAIIDPRYTYYRYRTPLTNP